MLDGAVCTELVLTVQGGCLMGQSAGASFELYPGGENAGGYQTQTTDLPRVVYRMHMSGIANISCGEKLRNGKGRQRQDAAECGDRVERYRGTELREIPRDRVERDTEGQS